MSDKSFMKLGQIYGNILSGVEVVEEKTLSTKNQKLGTKKGPGGKEPNAKDAAHLGNEDTSGPENADGFQKSELDIKNKKVKDDNLYNIKKLSYGEEDEESLQKNVSKTINNFMANKSTFDKLFEAVMNDQPDDLQELGIDNAGEEGSGGEFGGEDDLGDEGEVTIKIDRETAQKLHDVLMGVLTTEEPGEGETEEFGGEDEGKLEGEDEENSYDEDEESMGGAKPLSKSVEMGKQNKVSNIKPSGGKASGDYTDDVKGDAGSAPKPDFGKQNKVKSSKTSKPGTSYFA